MDDCFDRLMFKNRPGIQTISSIFFTLNSVLMVVFLFCVLSAEEVAVELKLSSVDSNPEEVKIAGSLVVASFYISSLVDLYLVIGIEDNSRVPMLAYMWWSSFTAVAHALGLVAIAVWRGNKENMPVIGPFVTSAGMFTLVKVRRMDPVHFLLATSDGSNRSSLFLWLKIRRMDPLVFPWQAYFARKVYRYSMLVLHPDFVAAEAAELSAAATGPEKAPQEPPVFSPRRCSKNGSNANNDE